MVLKANEIFSIYLRFYDFCQRNSSSFCLSLFCYCQSRLYIYCNGKVIRQFSTQNLKWPIFLAVRRSSYNKFNLKENSK